MRTPSDRLVRLLTTQRLCTQAEIDSCEPFVRQLCRDLPDFDSVWLDALVQRRLITAWQADQLQSDNPETILAGRYQRQLALGRSTFLASDETHRKQFALRQIRSAESRQQHDPELPAEFDHPLEDLLSSIDRLRSSIPTSLVLPDEIVSDALTEQSEEPAERSESHRYLVSRFIPGWSVDELLIRGGRLPWEVVAEVGRELLSALTWLESARLLHGDLVLRNVRLDFRGGVHLVDPFIRRLQRPQIAFNEQLLLRDCDGVAPEQIGTGRTADVRSELYALGCVLWQMLTSRPVVLSADPVTRMMKLKDHDIADVRGAVPDCPEWMSRLIQSMTRRSPELRPGTAAEVSKAWKSASGNSHAQCRALAKRMPDHMQLKKKRPSVRMGRQRNAWLWPASAVSVIGVLVILAARSGVLPRTLHLGQQAAEVDTTANSDSKAVRRIEKTSGPIPLPPVDADGFIQLTSDAPYFAERRDYPGTLRIECSDSQPAEIIVPAGTQWILQARTLELKGVTVTQQNAAAASSDGSHAVTNNLVAVQSGALVIDGCVIQSPVTDNFSGLAWHRLPGAEGSLIIRNSVFAGGGYAMSFNHPPRRCELDNVLMANRGSGILCEFRKGDPDTWDLFCTNVTQRFGFSVLDAVIHDDGMTRLGFNLTARESVFSPQMAIIRLQPPANWKPSAMQVQLRGGETGNPAVVPPDIPAVIYIDASLGQPVSLPESQVTNTGVLLADLIFDDSQPSVERAVPGSPWVSSSLVDFEGPKLTTMMPGIVVSRLPQME